MILYLYKTKFCSTEQFLTSNAASFPKTILYVGE